jgi:hypothetical protein
MIIIIQLRLPCALMSCKYRSKGTGAAGCQWITTIILATQEVEIRRTVVRGQLGKIVPNTLS